MPFAGLPAVPQPLYPASCPKTAATVGRFSRLRVPNPTEKHYLCPQRWFRHADRQPHPSVTGLKGNAVRIGDSSRCCKFRFSPVRGPHRGPSATRENHTVTTLSATGPRGPGRRRDRNESEDLPSPPLPIGDPTANRRGHHRNEPRSTSIRHSRSPSGSRSRRA